MELTPGNAQHIGAREAQQDAFGFSDLSDESFRAHAGVLAVVADGMGGLEHGDRAGRETVAAVVSAYKTKSADESIPDALLRATRSANQAVFQLGAEIGSPGDIGATLVAAVFHDDKLHWITVGDSHLMLGREGEITVLNQEHTYARELSDKVAEGQLSAEIAGVHPERGSLTSYMGMPDLGETDRSLRGFPLSAGDRVLLASDGLTKAVAPTDIAAKLDSSAQEICESLVDEVIEQELPEQDNVTVLCLQVAGGKCAASIVPPVDAEALAATEVLAESASSFEPAFAAEPEPTTPSAGRRWVWVVGAAAALAIGWFVWQGQSTAPPLTEEGEDGVAGFVVPAEGETREESFPEGSATPAERDIPPIVEPEEPEKLAPGSRY